MIRTTELNPVSNDAQGSINTEIPYLVQVGIQGVSSLLFHRWSVEAVAEKAAAKKGSKAKKTDDIETFVYRMDDGTLGIPGEYLRQAIIGAAKFRQDPRSPRKSAMDLYKAGVVSMTELTSLGKDTWDYVDQRRVVIQRSAITRSRPALKPGWKAEFELQVLLPEYIEPMDLQDVVVNAGRLIGVGDFRPTYGRFGITKFEILKLQ